MGGHSEVEVVGTGGGSCGVARGAFGGKFRPEVEHALQKGKKTAKGKAGSAGAGEGKAKGLIKGKGASGYPLQAVDLDLNNDHDEDKSVIDGPTSDTGKQVRNAGIKDEGNKGNKGKKGEAIEGEIPASASSPHTEPPPAAPQKMPASLARASTSTKTNVESSRRAGDDAEPSRPKKMSALERMRAELLNLPVLTCEKTNPPSGSATVPTQVAEANVNEASRNKQHVDIGALAPAVTPEPFLVPVARQVVKSTEGGAKNRRRRGSKSKKPEQLDDSSWEAIALATDVLQVGNTPDQNQKEKPFDINAYIAGGSGSTSTTSATSSSSSCASIMTDGATTSSSEIAGDHLRGHTPRPSKEDSKIMSRTSSSVESAPSFSSEEDQDRAVGETQGSATKNSFVFVEQRNAEELAREPMGRNKMKTKRKNQEATGSGAGAGTEETSLSAAGGAEDEDEQHHATDVRVDLSSNEVCPREDEHELLDILQRSTSSEADDPSDDPLVNEIDIEFAAEAAAGEKELERAGEGEVGDHWHWENENENSNFRIYSKNLSDMQARVKGEHDGQDVDDAICFRHKFPKDSSASDVAREGEGAPSPRPERQSSPHEHDHEEQVLDPFPDELTEDWLFEQLDKGRFRNIVILTGAGISTSVGIPDFRSKRFGLFDKISNDAKLCGRFPELQDAPDLFFNRQFVNKYGPKVWEQDVLALLKEMHLFSHGTGGTSPQQESGEVAGKHLEDLELQPSEAEAAKTSGGGAGRGSKKKKKKAAAGGGGGKTAAASTTAASASGEDTTSSSSKSSKESSAAAPTTNDAQARAADAGTSSSSTISSAPAPVSTPGKDPAPATPGDARHLETTRPSLTHLFCGWLHLRGFLKRVYTQNIDGLHSVAILKQDSLHYSLSDVSEVDALALLQGRIRDTIEDMDLLSPGDDQMLTPEDGGEDSGMQPTSAEDSTKRAISMRPTGNLLGKLCTLFTRKISMFSSSSEEEAPTTASAEKFHEGVVEHEQNTVSGPVTNSHHDQVISPVASKTSCSRDSKAAHQHAQLDDADLTSALAASPRESPSKTGGGKKSKARSIPLLPPSHIVECHGSLRRPQSLVLYGDPLPLRLDECLQDDFPSAAAAKSSPKHHSHHHHGHHHGGNHGRGQHGAHGGGQAAHHHKPHPHPAASFKKLFHEEKECSSTSSANKKASRPSVVSQHESIPSSPGSFACSPRKDDSTPALDQHHRNKVDLLFVFGTSLQVSPFCAIPNMAGKNCVRVLVNAPLADCLENGWSKKKKCVESGAGGAADKEQEPSVTSTYLAGRSVTLRPLWTDHKRYSHQLLINDRCDAFVARFFKHMQMT